MDRTGVFDRRPALSWVLAVLPPCAATLAAYGLDGHFSLAGLTMIYTAAVAIASAALPRGPAALAALLSVTALNFSFVPPRGSLSVAKGEYWWILAALLGLSLGLGALFGSLRARRAEAEIGRVRVLELHRLSETMAAANGTEAMAMAAARFLQETTGHPSAIYLRRFDGASLRRFACPEGDHFDDRAATWAIDNGRPVGAGSLNWPELAVWCAPFARSQASGAVQVATDGGPGLTPTEAEHWAALARQVGLAIDRERAAGAASHAEQSARAEAARNTLLASLSHDLRTPLAGIVGTASLLRTQGADLSEQQSAALLVHLEHDARDLTLMADNILQIARLSQPRIALSTEWESTEDILVAAIARMRRRWPDASIQLEIPGELPLVKAEAGLLAQAIANLVDNAARHGGAPPSVLVRAEPSCGGVVVAVRDRGPGLPPGDPADLFEPWRRGHPGRADGSGLGLAIAKLVAEAHGGSINAIARNPGAEFRLELPATDRPGDAA